MYYVIVIYVMYVHVHVHVHVCVSSDVYLWFLKLQRRQSLASFRYILITHVLAVPPTPPLPLPGAT